jgi:hypothetical protein
LIILEAVVISLRNEIVFPVTSDVIGKTEMYNSQNDLFLALALERW